MKMIIQIQCNKQLFHIENKLFIVHKIYIIEKLKKLYDIY